MVAIASTTPPPRPQRCEPLELAANRRRSPRRDPLQPRPRSRSRARRRAARARDGRAAVVLRAVRHVARERGFPRADVRLPRHGRVAARVAARRRRRPRTVGRARRRRGAALARFRTAGVPITWIGHSLGGQLVPFVHDRRGVAKIITVAAGSGYWRENSPRCAARCGCCGTASARSRRRCSATSRASASAWSATSRAACSASGASGASTPATRPAPRAMRCASCSRASTRPSRRCRSPTTR